MRFHCEELPLTWLHDVLLHPSGKHVTDTLNLQDARSPHVIQSVVRDDHEDADELCQ